VAIFHFSSSIVRRAGSALARKAHHTGTKVSHGAGGRHAYLAAARHLGPDGLETDYRGKRIIDASFHLPEGTRSRSADAVWLDVDTHKVKQSRTGKVYRPVVALDIVGALPHELTEAQNVAAARAFGDRLSMEYRVPVTVGVHPADNDERNIHAHFLVGVRTIDKDGKLGPINQKLNVMHAQPDPKLGRERSEVPVQVMRRMWEETINAHLALAGRPERIDRRSCEERGIEPKKYIPVEEYRALQKEKKLIQAAKQAANTRAISGPEIRKHLERIARECAAEAGRRRRAIDDIKAGRRETVEPKARIAVGSIFAYKHDAFGQFFKDMERQNRLARRRPRTIVREYTQEERELMYEHGLIMKKAQRVERSARTLLDAGDLGHVQIAAPKQNDAGWVKAVRRAANRNEYPQQRRAQ
jgi:MobA/MobL family protein